MVIKFEKSTFLLQFLIIFLSLYANAQDISEKAKIYFIESQNELKKGSLQRSCEMADLAVYFSTDKDLKDSALELRKRACGLRDEENRKAQEQSQQRFSAFLDDLSADNERERREVCSKYHSSYIDAVKFCERARDIDLCIRKKFGDFNDQTFFILRFQCKKNVK